MLSGDLGVGLAQRARREPELPCLTDAERDRVPRFEPRARGHVIARVLVDDDDFDLEFGDDRHILGIALLLAGVAALLRLRGVLRVAQFTGGGHQDGLLGVLGFLFLILGGFVLVGLVGRGRVLFSRSRALLAAAQQSKRSSNPATTETPMEIQAHREFAVMSAATSSPRAASTSTRTM